MAAWHGIMNVSATGVLPGTKYALAAMIANGGVKGSSIAHHRQRRH
jgi:hypothetical protein